MGKWYEFELEDLLELDKELALDTSVKLFKQWVQHLESFKDTEVEISMIRLAFDRDYPFINQIRNILWIIDHYSTLKGAEQIISKSMNLSKDAFKELFTSETKNKFKYQILNTSNWKVELTRKDRELILTVVELDSINSKPQLIKVGKFKPTDLSAQSANYISTLIKDMVFHLSDKVNDANGDLTRGKNNSEIYTSSLIKQVLLSSLPNKLYKPYLLHTSCRLDRRDEDSQDYVFNLNKSRIAVFAAIENYNKDEIVEELELSMYYLNQLAGFKQLLFEDKDTRQDLSV